MLVTATETWESSNVKSGVDSYAPIASMNTVSYSDIKSREVFVLQTIKI